ncbi:hypothetical protein E2C01_019231 [Portunus trituberculatus]|uniref:Uncharacterized protein n=1 Tax=Portunus trituberculatus TaxID=210409 RepID=A0A5B7DX12_PORTR|nr:hypothetical protein [Portunus trituberculatus]
MKRRETRPQHAVSCHDRVTADKRQLCTQLCTVMPTRLLHHHYKQEANPDSTICCNRPRKSALG